LSNDQANSSVSGSRHTGLTRKTISKWLNAPERTEPKYQGRIAEDTKIAPFAAQLIKALGVDSRRLKRDKRTVLRLFKEIQAQGFDGDYSRVTEFVRRWRETGG
jgi:transposase